MPTKVSMIMCGSSSSSSSSSGGGGEERTRKTMGRGRIEIKKIENVSSRQVTFSKRRAGLMKKAKELAILCDAEVGVIIFSSTGKLYDFASSRLQNIISRYERSSNGWNDPVSGTQQEANNEVEALKAEIVKLRKGQRLMMGKELEGLNYKELENLERQLHDGMLAIKNRKDMALLEEIEQIKLREQKTMKENEALKKEIAKHLYKSTSGHEICLVGRKSPFVRPSAVTYLGPDNGDAGISLHLGLSQRDDHPKRKIPKAEHDP
ncbi:MADS-box transcription factor 23-like [Bidens hawaiensis]|uniref:MADS-box transcription factor 23-like n=1 Tax=Bidens hawaiensis TaxID=980011 RepID=UPI00404A50F8